MTHQRSKQWRQTRLESGQRRYASTIAKIGVPALVLKRCLVRFSKTRAARDRSPRDRRSIASNHPRLLCLRSPGAGRLSPRPSGPGADAWGETAREREVRSGATSGALWRGLTSEARHRDCTAAGPWRESHTVPGSENSSPFAVRRGTTGRWAHGGRLFFSSSQGARGHWSPSIGDEPNEV